MSVASDSSNPASLGRRLGIEKLSEKPREASTKTVTRTFFTTAGAIALEAPFRQNKWAKEARVSWELIHQLRKEMESMGIDWRKLHQEIRKKQA